MINPEQGYYEVPYMPAACVVAKMTISPLPVRTCWSRIKKNPSMLGWGFSLSRFGLPLKNQQHLRGLGHSAALLAPASLPDDSGQLAFLVTFRHFFAGNRLNLAGVASRAKGLETRLAKILHGFGSRQQEFARV